MSSSQSPGSRAIKIPLHRPRENPYVNPSRRRRLARGRRPESMSNNDSADVYSPGSSSESASVSSTRTRDARFQETHMPVASPSRHALQPRRHTYDSSTTAQSYQQKEKQRATLDNGLLPPNSITKKQMFSSLNSPSTLSQSMLASSSYKSISLTPYHGDSDDSGPARIITYTKQSQGFTWNDELFLPSYIMGRGRHGGGSRRRRRYGGGYRDEDEMDLDDDNMDSVGDFDEDIDACPVADIFVTDEEAASMLP